MKAVRIKIKESEFIKFEIHNFIDSRSVELAFKESRIRLQITLTNNHIVKLTSCKMNKTEYEEFVLKWNKYLESNNIFFDLNEFEKIE